jgi:hypothetical protein
VGLAPREVRLVILTVGLVWAGIVGVGPDPCGRNPALLCVGQELGGTIVLEAALGLITVLATITTIQRIVATLRQAAASEDPSAGGATSTQPFQEGRTQ